MSTNQQAAASTTPNDDYVIAESNARAAQAQAADEKTLLENQKTARLLYQDYSKDVEQPINNQYTKERRAINTVRAQALKSELDRYDAEIQARKDAGYSFTYKTPIRPAEVEQLTSGGQYSVMNIQKGKEGNIDYQIAKEARARIYANPLTTYEEAEQIFSDVSNRVRGYLTPPNVETDYAGTLAARGQGYNVGSGLSKNLPDTFQKDFDRRFGEHNKLIELTEGASTVPAQRFSEEPKPVTPQNPRPHILTGQPPSEYANPDFAQKGSDKYNGIKQQVHVLDSSLPVSKAELSTGPFELEGQNATAAIFGIAPTKPRKLSDVDISHMSPAEIEAYNKQVQVYNQYVGYVTEQSKAFIKAQKIVNQGKWETNKKELLKYIAEAKKEGIQFVSINTKSGDKTVPIDQAFYNIVSTKDVIGIQAVPHIPEGYAVGGRLEAYPENLVLIPEPRVIKQDITGNITEQTGFGIRPQYETQPGTGMDFLTLVGKRATELVSENKDTLQGGLAAFGQVGVETFGGLVNIERLGSKAFAEFVNGTNVNGTENNSVLVPEIIVPETAPGVVIGGLTTGAMAAAATKNPSAFLNAGAQALQRAQGLVQRQGLLATIAQTTGYAAPFSPSAVIKAIPLRLVKVTVPVGRGIGLGTTAEIEAGTLVKQLKLGYGEGMGRFGIGRTEGIGYESEITRPTIGKTGITFIGIPKAERIPLEKLVYPTSRGGYRITEGPSGVFMTRPQTLDELIKIGKLTPEEKTVILAQKESVPITGKIKDVPLRTTLSPTGKEQPQASLLAGKETAKLEELVSGGQSRLKDKLPAVKGSIINQFFDIEPRQRRDLDVDLGLMKKPLTKQIALGIKEAKRIEEGMNALYNQETAPERLFKWEGRSVEVTTKGKNPQKVIEFVTEKESLDYGKGFKSNPDIVFGAKVPHKVTQPGGKGTYKMLGYRFQGLRKTSSILELGGDMPKDVGQFLGVSKGREKDIRDNVEYLLTKASQTKNEKEAIKLKETAIITERFARSRGWWSEQGSIPTVEFAEVEPPNIITSVSQGAKAGTGIGGSAVSKALVSKPTTESGIEGITGKKEKASIISPSIGRQFERSIGTRSPALRSPGRITSVGSRSVGLRSVGSVTSVGQPMTSVASPSIIRSTGSKIKATSSPAKPSSASKILPSPSVSVFESSNIPSPGSPGTPSPSTGLGFAKVTPLKPIKPELPLKLETLEIQKPKPMISIFPKPGSKTDRTKGNKPKLDAFVGNVSDVDIALGFNRREITPGIKASEKRYKKDIRFAYKRGGFTKLVTQKTGSVLSKKQRSILEREKPKEVKRQKRKTGGFF